MEKYIGKKIAAILLIAAMLASSAGCSGSQQSSSAAPAASQSSAASVSSAAESKASSASESKAASTESHKEVTLTMLHEHSEEAAASIVSSAAFRAMMDKFKKSHPWVTLEEQIVANSEIQKKYLALIAADELPDVTYVKYTWLKDTAGQGMLVDLTSYVNPDDYQDGLYSTTWEGKVYGVENKYSVYNLIVYNTELWKKAGYDKFPATLDELIAAAPAFQKLGIPAISFANSAKWFATSYFLSPLMYNYCGEEWVNNVIAGKKGSSYTDQNFVNALTELQKLAPLFNTDFNSQDDVWAASWYMQGKSASHIVGGWGIDTLKKLSKDYPDVWNNSRVVLLPTANGAKDTLINACGAAEGVSSRLSAKGMEEELKAAIDLCLQISSKDYAQYMAERASTTPVKIKMDFSGKGVQYEDLAKILNDTPNRGLNSNDYFPTSVAEAQKAEVQSLLAGSTTPEEAAKAIQKAQSALFG